jgi:hypothetical protein
MDVVRIEVEGLETLIVAFDSLLARLSDLRPAWPGVGEAVRRVTAEKFSSGGPGWADLSERYAARKSKQYPGAKILHASGAMEESLTKEGADGSIWEPSAESLEMGSTLPYALAHQTGVESRNLPQRIIYDDLTQRVAGDVLVAELTSYAKDLGLAA